MNTPREEAERFLHDWIREECRKPAYIEIHCALYEFRAQAETDIQRVKDARAALRAIERLARELSDAVTAMPNRARWAIWQQLYVSGTGETRPIAEWLDDHLSDDLAEVAAGAIGCLPAPISRKGKPAKLRESSRDILIRKLGEIFRRFGRNDRKPLHESAESAFIHELLHHEKIRAPDDLGRVLRTPGARAK